jgi:hypothetical protein
MVEITMGANGEDAQSHEEYLRIEKNDGSISSIEKSFSKNKFF